MTVASLLTRIDIKLSIYQNVNLLIELESTHFHVD
jgi:hypothetical protein